MSDESYKFTPSPTPKFPALIMRAFVGPDQHVEWVFTPPENTGWFTYKFEAKHEDGMLHINMFPDTITPKVYDL